MEQKIIFGSLMFEVTRKCNMECEHCLRGCTQNIDMTKEIVDSVLDKTKSIHTVIFTGGEPLLNLGLINYIIDGIISREIHIDGFDIISNGTIISNKVVLTLLKLYGYIYRCNTSYMEEGYCSFSITVDKFHDYIDEFDYVLYRGLSFFSLKEVDMNYQSTINMGKANDNGIGGRVVDVERLQLLWDGVDVEVESMTYINALGGIVTDCNLSYDVQEDYLLGNVLEDNIIDILIRNHEEDLSEVI